jgi:pilus assembly protein Flp/PilA
VVLPLQRSQIGRFAHNFVCDRSAGTRTTVENVILATSPYLRCACALTNESRRRFAAAVRLLRRQPCLTKAPLHVATRHEEEQMACVARLVDSLRCRDEGQDLLEYALLVALIALVAVGAVTAAGTSVSGIFNAIVAALPA